MCLKNKSLFISLSLVLLCLACSCSKNKGIDNASLNQTSLVPGVEWAVVQDPYVAFKENPGFEENVVSHARRGEIFEVMGKTTITTGKGNSKRSDTWYKFEPGWLEANVVMIYNNKLKAEREAKLLKD